MLQETYEIPSLPLSADLETKPVLKAVAKAHRHLAELKGRALSIPNQSVLINTLSLQEANASSEIESIVTTQDELFQSSISLNEFASPSAKEVAFYGEALRCGFEGLQKHENILSNNLIISMFRILKNSDAGFRSTPGTVLKNDQTGEHIYVPPQHPDTIIKHMSILERYINSPELDEADPLVKLAIIHHQFESIHPFPDGNGRLGRIINILFLVKEGLLDIPILYLSRYIVQNKEQYYSLLQSTRDDQEWEAWILFVLDAISETSQQSSMLISEIKALMAEFKHRMRIELENIYSQDLLNNLFKHPYTRIEYVMNELGKSRPTATRYLNALCDKGFLVPHTIGKRKYFVNVQLVELFLNPPSLKEITA